MKTLQTRSLVVFPSANHDDLRIRHVIGTSQVGDCLASSRFDGTIEVSTFGKAQYQWHPGHTRFVGHAEYPAQPSVEAESFGMADPDGPILHVTQSVNADTNYELPAASVIVIRGNIRSR